MKLTKRQRQVLKMMADPELDDADLVEDQGEVWIGLERTTTRLVMFLLRNYLISEDQYSGRGCHRYHINQWGHRALSDNSFEPQEELEKLILRAEKEQSS